MRYVLFTVRRVLLPLTIVFSFSHPYLQLVVHQVMNMVYLVWLVGLMPFKSSESNYLEIFNEGVLCLISLLFFAFLDILQDNNQKRNLGQLMVFILLAMLLVNLIIWFKSFILSLLSKLDLYVKQLLQCCCIKSDQVV